MLSGAKQVMGFFNTIFACIINNAFYIIILLLPFILFIIFNKKINFEKLKLKTILYRFNYNKFYLRLIYNK